MVLVYSIAAVLLVSMVSLIGIFVSFSEKDMHGRKVHLFLALAAGAMLGNAVLHLLPHALTLEQAAMVDPDHAGIIAMLDPVSHVEHGHQHGDDASAAHGHIGLFTCFMLLTGMVGFYFSGLLLQPSTKKATGGVESEGWMVIGADMVENILDGIVIGTAFLLSVPAGIAATITIFLHEIPLELGDYAVLRHAGFSRNKALLANFSSGLVSIFGVIFAVVVGTQLESFSLYATPLAAGGFLYIACSVLIPKLRNQCCDGHGLQYLMASLVGVGLMVAVLFFE